MNRFTRALGLFGNLKITRSNAPAGTSPTSFSVAAIARNTVARTDTAAKNLFKLPANAVLDDLVIFGAAASNAGTTATLSVGKTGTNTFFVNALDVKGATGAGNQHPAASNLGSVGTADLQVVGIYAETGAASSAGGPWTVTAIFHLP